MATAASTHAYFPWMYQRLVKAEQGEATAGRLYKEVDAEACGTACWKAARGRRSGQKTPG